MNNILKMKFSWLSVIPMLAATTVAAAVNLNYRDEMIFVKSRGFPFEWHHIEPTIFSHEPVDKYNLFALGLNILIALVFVAIVGIWVESFVKRFNRGGRDESKPRDSRTDY